MRAIFDRNGRTVGWLRNSVIFDLSHRYRAFVRGGTVFDFQANYLGTFERDYFRDSQGYAVAYVEGAAGGPSLPTHEIPPASPNLPIPPLMPLPSAPPVAPIPLPHWSKMNWDAFLTAVIGTTSRARPQQLAAEI